MKEIDVKKTFGQSLKTWRASRGISQEELGERADLHRTYISDVERGARNLSLESITRLASALNVSVAALFPEELKSEDSKADNRGRLGPRRGFVDILLVEDNVDDVEMTLHAFKQSRFANSVHVVPDGEEALDYLFCQGKHADRRPTKNLQIILLDLDLPKLHGLEVLRQIKADRRTSQIPVVMLTMSSDAYNIAECLKLGADNYIVKPVNLPQLIQATPKLGLHWALLEPAGETARKPRDQLSD